VKIHLVNGTSELLRCFHTIPSAKNREGEQVAAVRGVMYVLRALAVDGATHIGIATGRAGDNLAPELAAQFPLLEEGFRAWGLTVWPMTDADATTAIASAAAQAAAKPEVDQVIICSPDNVLAQCVQGTRVVQFDRVRKTTRDEAGVLARFGVPPASIPDYLALVGDGSDRVPGITGWGPKSAATVLAQFGRIEAIPGDTREWGSVRGAANLAAALVRDREQALAFRNVTTLRTDVVLFESVDELTWRGPTPALPAFRRRLAQYD
jgi:5'-3' exonuclease